ncbi:DNA repair protein complementing XP-C cells homolog [Orbicella faveolata]|uniref:DNA repair protein complementing XP-C cells homolog n=1 Tax=Orbicella faveolata TaxID=48498 RepID=UPI0009E32618|nr:DNA repair protein complementing XP-C cells homolog [Orbicella faveolata]
MWFQSEFSSTDDAKTGGKETDKQISKLLNLSEVFVAILRAHGLLTRLVYSLQPISAKGDAENKTSPKTTKKTPKGSKTALKGTLEGHAKNSAQAKKQKDTIKPEGIKTETESDPPATKSKDGSHSGKLKKEQTEKTLKKKSEKLLNNTKSATKNPKNNSKASKAESEDKNNTKDIALKQNNRKRPLRKRKKVDYSSCGNESGSEADEEWNEKLTSESEESEDLNNSRENSKKKDKTPLVRRRVPSADNGGGTPNEGSGTSFVDLVDDDSDFEVSSKPLVKRRVSAGSSGSKKKAMKIISSDDSDESLKCLGSVCNENDINWWTEVYLPVDKKWICVHLESSSVNHPELCEKQATQPMVYVVSFDNKNAIKDVTNRYASSWMSKTRKLRIDSDWWDDTLQPYKSRNKKMDQMEDSLLEDQLLEKPLPTSITEFKNHPLYVLKRHVLKFEAIYPETAAILGYCRGEAVYSRECLHMLHTREKWLNEALVVKGKVPRNEYGNVELFLPCMLPPGTKHIQINGIQRVAKKLGIDCAGAVVGFDFHCGFSHPVIDGVVVCEEFEQVLLDAWQEEEEQAEKKKAEKREKRMLANWRLLTRSLLIRERLKKRYDTEETSNAEASSSANGNDDVVTDTSVSWPLNRQGSVMLIQC